MVFRKILTKKAVCLYRDTKAFTLIDMMISLSIMTILAAYVYPSYHAAVNKNLLTEAAYLLAGDIRYIKQKSIANDGAGLPYILVVSAENYYNVYLKPLVRDKKVDFNELYNGRIKILGYSGVNNELRFNYLGNPSKSGTIVLQNENGEKIYVIVSAVMGRVRVDKNPPTSWEDSTY